MRTKNYFDPHYWQKCFVFRCRADCCPFVADCYASRKRDRQAAEESVQKLNHLLFEGSTLDRLLSSGKRVEVEHLLESHGVVFDSGANRLIFAEKQPTAPRTGN